MEPGKNNVLHPNQPQIGSGNRASATENECMMEANSMMESNWSRGGKWIVLGAAVAAISVGFGAFGAHGLKNWLAEQYPEEASKRLAQWETGARYQIYHALGLILLGLGESGGWVRRSKWVGVLFLVGVVLFSGSLYALAVTEFKVMGAVAPLGGLSFIVAWGGFAWNSYRAS